MLIALLLIGEIERFDPNSTIPDRVVRPLVSFGHSVDVLVTAQPFALRDMFAFDTVRWARLPRLSPVAAPDSLAPKAVAAAGHLRIREAALDHLEAAEDPENPYDYVLLVRGDARWLGDVADVAGLPKDAVATKRCLDWSGVNDKIAALPRYLAAPWLRARAQLENASLAFSSVETLLMATARARGVEVAPQPVDAFPFLDYYWWRSCYPAKYAGPPPHCVEDYACAAAAPPPRVDGLTAPPEGGEDAWRVARCAAADCQCLPAGLCAEANANLCATFQSGPACAAR